jgi:hypothetical protein
MRWLLLVLLVGCGDDSVSPADAPSGPDSRADAAAGLDALTDADTSPDGRIDAPTPGPPTFGILSGGGNSRDSTVRMQLFIGEIQVGTSADGTMSVEWGLAGRSVAP